ncbi:helix-turn-helix domain-containing protein [Haliscomenobacter hydrossis]|uniref:Helix-turn-helix domain-containing protein n=1 Tax=Haliscomenobacter hydrossis (strain ATCC 27775 / DSM 1100 / LMG 10767 / O) TaxID=760192 RepID=F4L3V1_HALH1|nr:helix-turn-helix domain-containing protein [Haliscomenobacter hydrossis]AEE48705.1 hypothetical protein Halhy_0798 [Haliscomenobacter hydrossis DSM 1100]
MSIEEALRSIIEEQMEALKTELKLVRKTLAASSDFDVWLKVGEAAKLLGCDPKHVNKLIENGFLSLSFLPGTDRGDKRISKKEVLELKEKFTLLKRSRL